MLDEQQLTEYIDQHFRRTLFRLETLDKYDVSSDRRDLARYLAGESGPDMGRKGPWMDLIRSEVARGMHTYRVHVVHSPLSDYLRFEFEWGYVCNARAGEHIRILDLTELHRPDALVDEDFWLIDNEQGVRMHYDTSGAFLGAEVASPELVERYRAASTAAWSAGVDFLDYWEAHPQYWQRHHAA